MGCNCNKGANATQYEVVSPEGKRLFGPSPFKTTVDAMAARHAGSKVRPVGAEAAASADAKTES